MNACSPVALVLSTLLIAQEFLLYQLTIKSWFTMGQYMDIVTAIYDSSSIDDIRTDSWLSSRAILYACKCAAQESHLRLSLDSSSTSSYVTDQQVRDNLLRPPYSDDHVVLGAWSGTLSAFLFKPLRLVGNTVVAPSADTPECRSPSEATFDLMIEAARMTGAFTSYVQDARVGVSYDRQVHDLAIETTSGMLPLTSTRMNVRYIAQLDPIIRPSHAGYEEWSRRTSRSKDHAHYADERPAEDRDVDADSRKKEDREE
jgi:hypothetical protein